MSSVDVRFETTLNAKLTVTGLSGLVIRLSGPAHQSWTPMTILSNPLGGLERFGADVAE
jgi:hypothetical protein